MHGTSDELSWKLKPAEEELAGISGADVYETAWTGFRQQEVYRMQVLEKRQRTRCSEGLREADAVMVGVVVER